MNACRTDCQKARCGDGIVDTLNDQNQLEACDDGMLLWKRPSLPSSEGLLLRPLGETEIITQRGGQRCTAHRWHWALLPTAAGQATVHLPVMEASKFGKRLRFAPPTLTVTAQALPAWLPTEAAVGQPCA